MRIFVTGSGGMLGSTLVDAACLAGYEVAPESAAGPDILDYDAMLSAFAGSDIVVNCAAYTDVDGAENDRERAFSVNSDGAGRAAAASVAAGAAFIHISTDYVFDGSKTEPYSEDDMPVPLNVYGASKFYGERAVLENCPDALIVRTQALFGRESSDFIGKMLRLFRTDCGTVSVVNNQITCPTYCRHLADALLKLAGSGFRGIMHCSASGSCSWYEFARTLAEKLGADVQIRPVSSSEHTAAAVRPLFSVLDNTLYEKVTGSAMPHWQEGLDEYMNKAGIHL